MDLLLHSKFDGSICHIKNLKVPEHENEVAHRHDLLEKVWGFDITPTTRTVDNYILDLRKKFEPDPSNPKHILTIRGAGYKFVP